MTRPYRTIDTKAVHAGEPDPRHGGAVVMPTYQSANYLHEGTEDYFATKYVRLSNSPNHDALNAKIAALENGEAAMVTASGMAAISTALLTVLRSGEHLLSIDGPYGGTRNLLTGDLPRLGIECAFVDGADPDAWRAALRPNTRVIYIESITNPMMQVPDLRGVVAFARRHGLVSMIDNTMASPFNFRPLEIGFDIVLHSGTKYLNGHSDIAAGAAVGRAELVEQFAHRLSHLGGSLDPHACTLLHRGIKTLALRVARQNASAMTLAEMLDAHADVAMVNYPGLPSTRGHEFARELFAGYGGMLSLELAGGVEAAERFIAALELPIHAASFGGVETLVIRPAVTAYANVPAAERRRIGVTDGLVRMSVGIESIDELMADVEQALSRAALVAS